jgi:Ca2+/H+ antiporter, TMEM165/GDT1 family
MSFSVFLATFSVVFVAELGDKTQLAAMALATRHAWGKVFLGAAAAFVVLNLAAVLVGRALFVLLPLFWLQLASALLFLVFGVLTWRDGASDGSDRAAAERRGPVATAFLMILTAEIGDKTQIVTATLAAEHASQLSVFLGSTLALWSVTLVGVLMGRQLVRLVPLSAVKRLAALVFLGFGGATLYQVLHTAANSGR